MENDGVFLQNFRLNSDEGYFGRYTGEGVLLTFTLRRSRRSGDGI